MQKAYGGLPRVIERLQALGAPLAGMVEIGGGTWGHVQWEKQMKKAGLTPAFGAELIVRRGEDMPTCWALAEDPAALYRLTTAGWSEKYYGATTTEERMAAATGLVRFAGTGLDDPASFDYVDCSPVSARMQRKAADKAASTRRPLVIVSDNAYPGPDDAAAYRLFERAVVKPTPQWLLSDDELRQSFPGLTDEEFTNGVMAAFEVAERLQGVKLARAPLINFPGDLPGLCQQGKARRLAAGHIKAWDDGYEKRLVRELAMVREKKFESYFLMVADLVRWAKERMLVGPARGSSAGSLVCYLIGITEVDPMPFGLIFERFVDVTREDLPDIDIDFPDTKRDTCYVYLAEKYGAANVARIGTISSLKPLSALATAGKSLGVSAYESAGVRQAMFTRSSGDARANNCLIDTMNETGPGREFLAKFPQMKLAGEIEGHASHTGVHAAGVCVCNDPITNFCTVQEGVMHIDKKDAEELNLLKIDALGLRTLGVIEDSGVVTAEQLYSLPLDDPKVFELFNQRRYAGIFQWEGQALQSVTNLMKISKFSELDQITALARPGPLGGGAATRFVERHEGRETWEYPHPSLGEYLDESFGLVIYQEQVLRLCREIGGMTWEHVTQLRKAMSKSFGKEFFDSYGDKFREGALRLHGIKEKDSQAMWDEVNSMGSWAFNKSHAVSYGMISYWTAWLKTYHPLEYAAAALRNSQDEDAATFLLRELSHEGIKYKAFDFDKSQSHWAAVDGMLMGGFQNLVGIGAAKARVAIEARDSGKMTPERRAKYEAMEVKFKHLYPLHAAYGDMYENPQAHGIREGDCLTQINDFPDEGEVVFIGTVTAKDARDYNELVLVAKRGGKLRRGLTQFVDLKMVDDSSMGFIRVRVDPRDHDTIGRALLEKLRLNKDVLLVRGRKLLNIPMVCVTRVKCLTNPEIFNET